MSCPQEAECIPTRNGPVASAEAEHVPPGFSASLSRIKKYFRNLETNPRGSCTALGCLSLVLETVKNCITFPEGKVYIIYLDASITPLPPLNKAPFYEVRRIK